MNRLALISTLLLLPISAAAGSAAARTAAPAPSAEFVIASTRDGDSDLYLARADGRIVGRLTANRVGDAAPRWSPDGSRVLFVSNRDGDDEIFVVDADGGGLRQLTRNRVRDETPTWSPDGSRIAFVREQPTDLLELWVADADGTDARRLVRASRRVNEQSYSPTFSPDGRTIVFSNNRPGDGNPELYRVRADGGRLVRLTRTVGNVHRLGDDTMPSFSPDGSTIVFTSNRVAGNSELWTMRPDGSRQRRLVARPATDDWNARWSPDGTRIAFAASSATAPNARARIVVIRADGRGARVLQVGSEVDWRPAAAS